MVQLQLISGVINVGLLVVAAIFTLITIGVFADVNKYYSDIQAGDHCILFLELHEGFGANRICNFVIAGEAIALLLIIAAIATLVVSFIVSK